MAAPAIRVLPDDVINQIAAGEVIERPASVVKELVENSVDAGARRIAIEVAGGGKTLIRVVDDGCGISRADLRLAMTRHATSKLRRCSDLFGIQTMGFRGEALPSIAAVSRFNITSRVRGDTHPSAWSLEIAGGKIVAETEVGAPVGTSIEVRDLLYNLPARQKFMKTDATEMAHITDCVVKLALAHPDVHIRLRSGQRTTIDAAPSRDALERAACVLGKLGVGLREASGHGAGVRVRALLGDPSLAQKSSRHVQLFVGKRAVRNRELLAAVSAGYGELLGQSRFPTVVLFLDLDGDGVDVNVHPQKLEVRFADGAAVFAVVKGVIERAVSEAGWAAAEPEPSGIAGARSTQPSRAAERLANYAASRRLFAPRQLSASRAAPTPRRSIAKGSEPHRATPVAPSLGRFGSLTVLGPLDGTFIVCEGDGELVLVDAVRARRAIAASRFAADVSAGRVRTQRLLLPIEIDVELGAAARQRLEATGFELDASSLLAIPAGVDDDRALGLLHAICATDGDAADLVAEALIAEAPLDRADCARILADLDACEVADAPGLAVRAPVDELASRLSK